MAHFWLNGSNKLCCCFLIIFVLYSWKYWFWIFACAIVANLTGVDPASWRLYVAIFSCCLLQMSFQIVFTTISAYVGSFHLTEQIGLVATFCTYIGEVPCSELASWTGCVVDVYRIFPCLFESCRDSTTFTFFSVCYLIITLVIWWYIKFDDACDNKGVSRGFIVEMWSL